MPARVLHDVVALAYGSAGHHLYYIDSTGVIFHDGDQFLVFVPSGMERFKGMDRCTVPYRKPRARMSMKRNGPGKRSDRGFFRHIVVILTWMES